MSLDLSRHKMDGLSGLSLLRNKRYFDSLLNVSEHNSAAATLHAGLQQFGQLQHFMRNNFGSLMNISNNKHCSTTDILAQSPLDVTAQQDAKFERKGTH